jgi:hypothetical protein
MLAARAVARPDLDQMVTGRRAAGFRMKPREIRVLTYVRRAPQLR